MDDVKIDALEKAAFARDPQIKKDIAAGEKMMTRLGKGAHWGDWVVVGRALLHGVELAMNGGKRGGKTYNRLFREWLDKHEALDEPNISKDDRAALINIFSVPGKLDEWNDLSAKMTPGELARVSTPRTVWDHVKPKAEGKDDIPDEDDVDAPGTNAMDREGLIGAQADALKNAIRLDLNEEEMREALAEAWADPDRRDKLVLVHDTIAGLIRGEKAAARRREKDRAKEEAGEALVH